MVLLLVTVATEHSRGSENDFNTDSDCDSEFARQGLCTCGSLGRTHKRDCPLNQRNIQAEGGTVSAKPDRESDSALVCEAPTSPMVSPEVDTDPGRVPRTLIEPEHSSDSKPCGVTANPGAKDTVEVPSTCADRDGTPTEVRGLTEPPPSKKQRTATELQVGDYVCLHSSTPGKYHIPCRITEVVGDRYRLCCKQGLFGNCFDRSALTPVSSSYLISLDGWRMARSVRFPRVIADSVDLCECMLPVSEEVVVSDGDLTEDSGKTWVENPLYRLKDSDRETIVSRDWLGDEIIQAAQLLILQDYPNMSGLQPPTLGQTLSFAVHRREFVQILHIGNNHWCVVSNVGCDNWVVNVYDSMYSSVSTATARLIASVLLRSAKHFTVRVMDVARQVNGVDCGVLAIAYAYDICSGSDPCAVVYDHASIRSHLANSLEDCSLSRFPVSRARKPMSGSVKRVQKVNPVCVCRLPEQKGDRMAECDGGCETWFHQDCVDIPERVFVEEGVEWFCKSCSLSKSAVSPPS